MKKFLLILGLLLAFAAAAFVVWRNLPEKRFARHMVKARLYAKEGDLTAAAVEYEKAYGPREKYTPYASLEVLYLTNRMNLQDGKPHAALENTKRFVEAHRTNKEGKAVLADLAFRLGERETGFDALKDLFAQDPWNFNGRLLLAGVRTNQRRFDLAEEQLRHLSVRYPDSVRALLPLAETLLSQGRSQESREFLRRALERQPGNARAQLLLADSYLQQGESDSAQLMLDRWEESDPAQTRSIHIRKARLYSRSGRMAEAEAVLAPFRERKEDNVEALSELAVIHAMRGQYDSALALYRTIGEVSPKSREFFGLMSAYLEIKAQNPARALEEIKSLQITDRGPTLLAPLLAAYRAVGQDQKAREVMKQQPDSLNKVLSEFLGELPRDRECIGQWALVTYFGANRRDPELFKAVEDMYRRWPKQPMAIRFRTEQLSARGRFAEAAKTIATLPHPDIAQRRTYLGLLTRAGLGDKARAAAERLAADYPRLEGVNFVLGDYWAGKNKSRSMAYYRKELELNPENEAALNNLAWEYGVVQGDWEKAKPYLDKLKGIVSLDPRILDTIGWILARNGRAAEGEVYARNAVDLVPDYPPFLYHLASILKQIGKPDEARQKLEAALASSQPFAERKEAEKLSAEL